MSEMVCLMSKTTQEIECVCYDHKTCDIHINDGGNLVCRHGSNEGVVDGIVRVICPLEIATESKKWNKFLTEETTASR